MMYNSLMLRSYAEIAQGKKPYFQSPQQAMMLTGAQPRDPPAAGRRPDGRKPIDSRDPDHANSGTTTSTVLFHGACKVLWIPLRAEDHEFQKYLTVHDVGQTPAVISGIEHAAAWGTVKVEPPGERARYVIAPCVRGWGGDEVAPPAP